MPLMTVAQAAKHTGVHRTTITRAISSGKLSASRLDGGDYAIDPSELERVYPSNRPATQKRTSALHQGGLVQTDDAVQIRDVRIKDLERQLEEYRAREKYHMDLLAMQMRLIPARREEGRKAQTSKETKDHTDEEGLDQVNVEGMWKKKKGKKKSKKGKRGKKK